MSETERIINKIVADFEEAIGRLEIKSIFANICGENRLTPQEIYSKHKRQNDARLVRRDILKRVLWLNLGTEDEQKKILEPAAEKTVEKAMEEIKKRFNGLTFELNF